MTEAKAGSVPHSITEYPRNWMNSTYWLAFDPDVKGRAWAAMSNVHDLPRPKMWRRRSPVESFTGGIVSH